MSKLSLTHCHFSERCWSFIDVDYTFVHPFNFSTNPPSTDLSPPSSPSHAGKPLFAGTSTMNQIDKIMTCVPHPSRTDVESLHSPYAQPILDQLTRR